MRAHNLMSNKSEGTVGQMPPKSALHITLNIKIIRSSMNK